jgi:hypothetical protein
MKMLGIKAITQGFGSQRRNQRMFFRIILGPEETTESARIMKPETDSAPKDEVVMIVFAGGDIGFGYSKTAGHAQMQDQSALPGADEYVFSPAGQFMNGLSL